MKSLIFMALGALMLLYAPARADVVYQWTTVSATGPLLSEPGGVAFLAPTMVVTAAAVSTGSMNFQIGPCGSVLPCSVSGDDSGFVSFFDDSLPPHRSYGVLGINITFNADGTLSGSVQEFGEFTDFHASGAGDNWSGTFSADASMCGTCTMTGYFSKVEIPEPSSLALLGSGLLTLAFLRRRRYPHQVGLQCSPWKVFQQQ